MRRGVENLISIFIIIGVILAIGVILFHLAFRSATSNAPHESILGIMSARVYTRDGTTLIVEIEGSVLGGKTVNITGIQLKVDMNGALTPVNATLLTTNTLLQPGQIFHITGKATLNTQVPLYSNVIVLVKYCDVSGTCNHVATVTQIEPS